MLSREQPQQAAAYCQRHELLPSHAASCREPLPQTQVAVASRRLKLTLQGSAARAPNASYRRKLPLCEQLLQITAELNRPFV